ncbi:MAG: Uma2 family endonuclease, partial [Anaerolineae bacterium]
EQAETPAPVSGEELFKMGDIGRTELVRGKIIKMSPTGHLHGHVEVNFSVALQTFVKQHKIGRVFAGEVGIYTGRNPDTVRGADVAFVSTERLAQVQSQSYLDVAPELIVEIMSPDDRWIDIMEKLEEYFAIGVTVVWVADPGTRSVYEYRSVTDVQRFTSETDLTSEDLLPGFRVPVAELFDAE